MTDNQSSMSSVNPSASVSQTGKKSKPGKSERAARRSATGTMPGQDASTPKAMTFAAGAFVPKPQPGKFPVVFQTGAGEPSRDANFVPEPTVMGKVLCDFPGRFTYHEKYNEFRANAEISDDHFAVDLIVSALLRLCQQSVHSHVNMGLPQGDFAPVASTDVRVPQSVSAYIQQFGEFSVPALGTRFLYPDYECVIRSLVRAAKSVRDEDNLTSVFKRMWLPARSLDKRTCTLLAACLQLRLGLLDISIPAKVLEDALFRGDPPAAWEAVKGNLGASDAQKNRFDFLFKTNANEAAFLNRFTSTEATAVLTELGLSWPAPSVNHLGWDVNVKEVFTSLADEWARKSAAYASFFELSSSQVNRTAALGSQAQMAVVSTVDTVTILKTHLALSAPEFSLAACFPCQAQFSDDLDRRVVITSPLSVTQRATEFVQLDWR